MEVQRWSSIKQGYEWTTLADTRIGDIILTWDPEQDRMVNDTIYAFLDQQRMVRQYNDDNDENDGAAPTCVRMIRIAFEPDQFVDVTPNHMIHRLADVADFVPASMLHANDSILHQGVYHRVTHVTPFCFASDYYSPLTMSGTLMVNGVWFSNYVQMSGPHRIMYTHQLAHQFLAPLRMYYHFMPGHQNSPDPSHQGLHPYVQFLQTFYHHMYALIY